MVLWPGYNSVMQLDRNGICCDVVLDSFNMVSRDEDRPIINKYIWIFIMMFLVYIMIYELKIIIKSGAPEFNEFLVEKCCYTFDMHFLLSH